MKLAIIIILVTTALVLLLRQLPPVDQSTGRRPRKRELQRAKRNAVPSSGGPFRAVSIIANSTACAASRSAAGIRYLVGHAPNLPLPDCSLGNCNCRYAHHQDRRANPLDRRQSGSVTTAMYAHMNQGERRRAAGRRSTDWEGTALS